MTTQDVTKIEIGKTDQTVVLTRKDEGWQVSPGDHPVDVSRVDPMLDTLANLKVTALVSETRNYSRYELGENQQIRVTAYQNDKPVRVLQIGKAAETGRHTHIKLSEDPNVYHAQGNFRQDFDQSVESLRDKSVLAFSSDAVTELMIETGERQVTVKKTDVAKPPAGSDPSSEDDPQATSDMQWETTDGQVVAKDAMDKLLGALTRLECRTYLTDKAKDDFENPTYLIRIKGAETSVLEVFAAEDDSATEWPARSSLREDPFMLADFDIDPVTDFLSLIDGPPDADAPNP